MCGIIATFGKHPVTRTQAQYGEQKSRGHEGFGFLALRDNRIVAYRRTQTEAGIMKALNKVRGVDTILFHHRMPTSTANVPEAAHPIRLAHKDWKHTYYILHNGVITNDDKLIDDVRETGYTFSTELKHESIFSTAMGKVFTQKVNTIVNDSEILGFYIAEQLEGRRKSLPTTGAVAAIVVQEDKRVYCKIFAMRNNGNPLKPHSTKAGYMLASEGNGESIESYRLWSIAPAAMKDAGYFDLGETSYSLEYGYSTGVSGYYSTGKSKKQSGEVPSRGGVAPVKALPERAASKLQDYGLAELERLLDDANDDALFWYEEWHNAPEGAEKAALWQEVRTADSLVEKLQTQMDSHYGTTIVEASVSH